MLWASTVYLLGVLYAELVFPEKGDQLHGNKEAPSALGFVFTCGPPRSHCIIISYAMAVLELMAGEVRGHALQFA